jgi:hypothetical protein
VGIHNGLSLHRYDATLIEFGVSTDKEFPQAAAAAMLDFSACAETKCSLETYREVAERLNAPVLKACFFVTV